MSLGFPPSQYYPQYAPPQNIYAQSQNTYTSSQSVNAPSQDACPHSQSIYAPQEACNQPLGTPITQSNSSHILEECSLKQISAPKFYYIKDSPTNFVENSLINKIYSITIFPTTPEAVKTQASIVLCEKEHVQNFPFRINISLNCKTDKICIKKLTLGELTFNLKNVTCNKSEEGESFQVTIKTQRFKNLNNLYLGPQRTCLNIHLVDCSTKEEIFISKKVSVITLLAEKINSASRRLFDLSPKIAKSVKKDADFSSPNPKVTTSKRPKTTSKRPKYEGKDNVTPSGLPKKPKLSPVNETLVWSAVNREDSEEVIDENEAEIINLLFGNLPSNS